MKAFKIIPLALGLLLAVSAIHFWLSDPGQPRESSVAPLPPSVPEERSRALPAPTPEASEPARRIDPEYVERDADPELKAKRDAQEKELIRLRNATVIRPAATGDSDAESGP